MDIETTRICKTCKEKVILEHYNSVYYKNSYYHYDCFVSSLVNKKKNMLALEEAKKIADELKKNQKSQIENLVYKNHLYKWLQRSYNLVVIPNYFFQKMEDVFNGSYKGLNCGISPEDILFIWKKKKIEFDKTNDYNQKKGKVIEGTNRLNYDLAIVLSKYDSYKKWKDQQQSILENNSSQLDDITTSAKLNFKDVDRRVMDDMKKDKDLSNYLEEI